MSKRKSEDNDKGKKSIRIEDQPAVDIAQVVETPSVAALAEEEEYPENSDDSSQINDDYQFAMSLVTPPVDDFKPLVPRDKMPVKPRYKADDKNAVPCHSWPDRLGGVSALLEKLNLSIYLPRFVQQQVGMDILKSFEHKDLETILGIRDDEHRYMILEAVQSAKEQDPSSSPSMVPMERYKEDFLLIDSWMQSTICDHRGEKGGKFNRYKINRIEKNYNPKVWMQYAAARKRVAEENYGDPNEKYLFHGSDQCRKIALEGFDMDSSRVASYFGVGLYFSDLSSKAIQHTCPKHPFVNCYECEREMLVSRVILGNPSRQTEPENGGFCLPGSCHSVIGEPSDGGFDYAEYFIEEPEQAYPQYLITYQLVNDAEPTDDYQCVVERCKTVGVSSRRHLDLT